MERGAELETRQGNKPKDVLQLAPLAVEGKGTSAISKELSAGEGVLD